MSRELKPGKKVVMHTCGEADYYDGRLWTACSNPWKLCSEEVVMLEGFSGAFHTCYLQRVRGGTLITLSLFEGIGGRTLIYPEHDTEENKMPTCASCNIQRDRCR